jgi:hypothetical protein
LEEISPMPNRIRRFAAAFAIAGLALSLAQPALAVSRMADTGDERSVVPMIFDVVAMRPIGLLTVVIGTVFYIVPVAPIMAITRPTDIFKPLKPLVGYPVQFTFRDPIGQHPGPPERLCRSNDC